MLEAVIATSIVMIGILGIFITSQETVLVVYLARDRLIAAYLAKEGMEVIRNIRDQNFLRGVTPWNAGISSSTPAQLFIDGNGFYTTSTTATTTKFTREIIIAPTSDVDGIVYRINVRTIVRWAEHSFLVEENLYNWR